MEMDLLSSSGAGIAPLAPRLANLMRRIIGAEACVLCWVDANGLPIGVYSEIHVPEATDLFTNEFHLFVGPNECNSVWLAKQKGSPSGHLLNLGPAYFRSNTFNLLLRGTGLRHQLDLRVDVDGTAQVTMVMFRAPAQPFAEADVKKLLSLLPSLRRALQVNASGAAWSGAQAHSGHLLISADGELVEMISAEALSLLQSALLMGQDFYRLKLLQRPPRFMRTLCAELRDAAECSARMQIDVAGGAFFITATWMSGVAVAGTGGRSILVTLEHRLTSAVPVASAIVGLQLSPLQSRIAMYAAGGGRRADCSAHHKVSTEALKKHLREIYAATGAADWDALPLALVGT